MIAITKSDQWLIACLGTVLVVRLMVWRGQIVNAVELCGLAAVFFAGWAVDRDWSKKDLNNDSDR